LNINGTIKIIGDKDLKITPGGLLDATILVEVNRKDIKETRNDIQIGLYNQNKLIQKISTGFTGPVPGMR